MGLVFILGIIIVIIGFFFLSLGLSFFHGGIFGFNILKFSPRFLGFVFLIFFLKALALLFGSFFIYRAVLAFLLVDFDRLLDPLDRVIKVTGLGISRSQCAENICLVEIRQFGRLCRQGDRPLAVA